MDSINIGLYISKLNEYSRSAYVYEDFIDCDNTDTTHLIGGYLFPFSGKVTPTSEQIYHHAFHTLLITIHEK